MDTLSEMANSAPIPNGTVKREPGVPTELSRAIFVKTSDDDV